MPEVEDMIERWRQRLQDEPQAKAVVVHPDDLRVVLSLAAARLREREG